MAKLGRIAAIGGGLMALAGAGAALLAYRERKAEQPGYKLIDSDDGIEVRDYPALVVAETVAPGDRLSALNAGFDRLADYISGRHRGPGDPRSDEKIAMTAPVLADRTERGQWRTRFVMPAAVAIDALPTPDGGVRVTELPARRAAAIRFSGSAGDEALADHERSLRLWLAEHGYAADGPAEHAYYNSPFVPPPLRHNEVLVPVVG
ncbi:MAG TPA: heme-binding protein [Sphingomonas sp.]|nr:heme-binding protein [Sphingomonas sp.]